MKNIRGLAEVSLLSRWPCEVRFASHVMDASTGARKEHVEALPILPIFNEVRLV
jgi:hypothetical protein